MEWGRQIVFVNHFYFYIWDPEWGPAFIKTNAYAPWPMWIYLNGHEWAKRQLDKAGIADPLDLLIRLLIASVGPLVTSA